MATDNTQPAGSGNKTLWLVIMALALVIVTGAAIGGTYMFMKDDATGGEAEHAKKAPLPKPVFLKIDPFTANLQDARGRILYIRIALKVDDEPQASRLTEHMPQVRNRILMILTDSQAEQLTTSEGKQMLANKLQVAIAEPFIDGEEPIGVQGVLFTDFIVQ